MPSEGAGQLAALLLDTSNNFLWADQSNQNRPHVNTDRCLVMVVVGSSRPGLATLRPPRSQRRRTGSAPSKSAKDEPIGPPPVGGDYALLLLGLALLSSHRTRRAFCSGGAECGACGSRSGYLRSFAGRKLPADASGGSPQDGQGSCERLPPDHASAFFILRGERLKDAAYKRSEAGSYLLLERRRSSVVVCGI